MNQGTVGTHGVLGAGPPEADVALGLTGSVQGEGLPLPARPTTGVAGRF